GPIERYLDDLFLELRASVPRDARAMLSEAEAHLRDVADEAERAGLSRVEAERVAVEGFGDAHHLAATARNRTGTHLITRILVSGWTLGCIGAMAVGASWLIAGLM